MWTISNEQLSRISGSLRSEFEKRVYFHLSGEGYTQRFPDRMVEQNIRLQTEKLINFRIMDEALAIEFIKLSFLHPVMRREDFPETLSGLFEEAESENEKIENLVTYLNENNHVPEF